MKTSNGFRFLLVIAVTFALQASAFAAHNIWFTNPTNGQKFFLQPGQSTVGIFVNINYEWGPHPYPYTDVKTKVKVDNGAWLENLISFTTDPLVAGQHTLSAELWEYYVGEGWTQTATAQIGFTVVSAYVDITVKNSFNGGTVVVDGATVSSGTTFHWQSGYYHTAQASNQNYQASGQPNYFRVFDNLWRRDLSDYGTSNQVSILADGDATFEARFVRQFDITFQNSFVGVGNGGVMNVNGTQYTLPRASFPVLENNSAIQAEALNSTVNGIAYTFSHWGDGSTVRSRTFTHGDHATYTAIFNPGVPLSIRGYFGLAQVAAAGQNLRLQWTEHSSPGVTQYQVWRKMKQGSTNTEPVLLTTLNRGTTSYTDHTFNVTNGYTDLLLMYDVRAYYATENTYAEPDYLNLFGTGSGPIFEKIGSPVVPTSFAMSTYPNPFNPTTTIHFDLPVEGNVSLAIFDLLGRKVADLTDAYADAGSYSIRWDANNNAGASLAGGMYFARMSVRDVDGKVKFSTVNKLLLMK